MSQAFEGSYILILSEQSLCEVLKRGNLIDKIGADAVQWLEDNRPVVKHWTRSELEEIIQKYKI